MTKLEEFTHRTLLALLTAQADKCEATIEALTASLAKAYGIDPSYPAQLS